jgi:hypothetical protein
MTPNPASLKMGRCAPGTSPSLDVRDRCIDCPSGKYSPGGLDACLYCEGGLHPALPLQAVSCVRK